MGIPDAPLPPDVNHFRADITDLLDRHEYPEDEGQADQADIEPAPVIAAADAETHLRCWRYWQVERLRIVEHAEAELSRIRTWAEKETGKIDRKIGWHEIALRGFLARTGRRSLSLIHGAIRFLSGRERVEVQEPEKFLAWARSNAPILIRVKEEPDKQAIARHIKAHGGEIPEGCDLVKGEDTFKVDPVEAPEGKRDWPGERVEA